MQAVKTSCTLRLLSMRLHRTAPRCMTVYTYAHHKATVSHTSLPLTLHAHMCVITMCGTLTYQKHVSHTL